MIDRFAGDRQPFWVYAGTTGAAERWGTLSCRYDPEAHRLPPDRFSGTSRAKRARDSGLQWTRQQRSVGEFRTIMDISPEKPSLDALRGIYKIPVIMDRH
jgi:hypothetical protein